MPFDDRGGWHFSLIVVVGLIGVVNNSAVGVRVGDIGCGSTLLFIFLFAFGRFVFLEAHIFNFHDVIILFLWYRPLRIAGKLITAVEVELLTF